ncbi:acyl carrier protein [Plantactinospora sp. CA-290183]|uniref:acyl carrier protein n=1 Tax=Plantactinospora sp. CA-290183 TaxID=3240006 RepID=UPI003D8D7993
MTDSESLVRAACAEAQETPVEAVDVDADIESVQLIRIVMLLQEKVGAELPLESILDCRTVRDIAAVLDSSPAGA